MNYQNPEKRRLSILFALWICSVVAAGILIYKATRRPLDENVQPTVAVEPAVAPEPAPVVESAIVAAQTNSASTLEEQWGIQVLGLALTNNDTAVHVRYKVVAPEKTLLLAETNSVAYLINQANGESLRMITPPQDGGFAQGASARTIRRMIKQAGQFPAAPSRLIAGRTYLLQIPNWGQALQSGSKVSFVVGDFRQDDLTVE